MVVGVVWNAGLGAGVVVVLVVVVVVEGRLVLALALALALLLLQGGNVLLLRPLGALRRGTCCACWRMLC